MPETIEKTDKIFPSREVLDRVFDGEFNRGIDAAFRAVESLELPLNEKLKTLKAIHKLLKK